MFQSLEYETEHLWHDFTEQFQNNVIQPLQTPAVAYNRSDESDDSSDRVDEENERWKRLTFPQKVYQFFLDQWEIPPLPKDMQFNQNSDNSDSDAERRAYVKKRDKKYNDKLIKKYD